MPDSVTQPEHEHEQKRPPQLPHIEDFALLTPRQELAGSDEVLDADGETQATIVWTPRFLVGFTLLLIGGVSIDSLLAESWSNGVFNNLGLWFLLGHIILTALGWLVLGVITRSRWIRVGCIFGGACMVFLTLNAFTNLMGVNPNSPAQSYINAAACTALLGAYIGLSIENTLLSAWDHWLFFLLTVLGCASVALIYFLTPQPSMITLDNAIATATLVAACLVWWARPSCWKQYPGPAFLFGIVPVIQLLMALLNNSMHNYFLLQVLDPQINLHTNSNNFFFAQLLLLLLLAACLRHAKSEIHN